MGRKGEGVSRTCMKDTWTKPKGVGSRVGWKGRKLYLNNSKKNRKKLKNKKEAKPWARGYIQL